MPAVLRVVKSSLRRTVFWGIWLLRPRLPWPLARRVLALRTRRALGNPARLDFPTEQMTWLLGETDAADTIDEVSRRHLEFTMLANELRWHPSRYLDQRVEGIEHLRAARDEGRGVVVSFVHHAYFPGMFGAVSRAGVPLGVVSGADVLSPDVTPNIRQHMRVVGRDGSLVSAAIGTEGFVERLQAGEVLAIASDVPGSSQVRFAGRQVRCSSGAIWAARSTGAPIVLMSTLRDDNGSFVQLSPPLDPREGEVQDVLEGLIAHHEAAVLAWPEAAYHPTLCWQPASVDGGSRS